MNREAELRRLYQEKLEPELKKMEKARKEQLKSHRLQLFIFIMFGLSMFVPASLVPWFYKIPLIIVVFITGVVVISLNTSKSRAYTQNYKTKIVQEVLHFINPDYKYFPEGSIKRDDYLKSGLYSDGNEYEGEDYVTGVAGKTPFQFAELYVYSEGDKSTTIYFSGIFFIAEFNKHLHEKTFVFPEKSKINILTKREKTHFGDYERLTLENPKFEEVFSVYGSSQQEARYILTPAMMEAMLDIHNKYNFEMSFSFIGNNMYFGMSTCKNVGRENYFQPNIDGYCYEDIEEIVYIFDLIETIINEMDLNTRIWTKE